MATEEQDISSITVKAPGKGESRLKLTDRRVSARFDGGWLGSETTSIPLEAISYATVSWERSFGWLFLAIIAAAAGFLFPEAVPNFQIYAWVIAGIFVLIFTFYKPGKVWIYSGEQRVGGTPESTDEAEAFIEELVVTLPDLREVSGST